MKKRFGITVQLRDKWIEEWISKNAKSSHYFSFLTTQDIKSSGSKVRVPDLEPGQDRNLFSTNERMFFYQLNFSGNYLSIKEQYPLLPLERAIAIAERINVPYPTYPYSSNVDVVMTSDFYCETISGEKIVYSIKDEKVISTLTEREKSNLENKLKIEKLFWESKNVKWHLILSDRIKTASSSNLGLIFNSHSIPSHLKILSSRWVSYFINNLKFNDSRALREIIEETAELMSISFNDSIEIFQHCVWYKKIIIDLNQHLFYENPACSFKIRINLNE